MRFVTFDYQKDRFTSWHQHASGQLYWPEQGAMVVEMAKAQWTVTPGSLGWFPAGLRHQARFPGPFKGKSLYPDSAVCAAFPQAPGIYGADLFMQALLERICLSCQPDMAADYQRSLLTLLAAEIARAPQLPLQLRLPADRRARNIADYLLAHPETPMNQLQLAQHWGLSVRSLSRLFREQTGLSFSQWRQQAKVVVSLQWVLAGESIGEVAARSGYSNTSAYIDVFRARFGNTPGQMQMKKR